MGNLRLKPFFSNEDTKWAEGILKEAYTLHHKNHVYYDYDSHEDPRFLSRVFKHAADKLGLELQTRIDKRKRTIRISFHTDETIRDLPEVSTIPAQALAVLRRNTSEPTIDIRSKIATPSLAPSGPRKPKAKAEKPKKPVEKIVAALSKSDRPLTQEELMSQANLRVWPKSLPGVQEIKHRNKDGHEKVLFALA